MVVTPDDIQAGLMQRGLPQHVARAFVMNFQDESGLNPGINEHSPTVPGSRGGFGLYQLTGPRRRGYEQFAAQRGVPAEDADAQLDYLMYELQGSESRAAKSIMASRDTGEAAVAIVRDFLRPAKEHLDRRTARYAGGTYAPPQGGNALSPAMPPQTPQQAPQQAPQPPQWQTGAMDPAAFRNARNALAPAPLVNPGFNSLARYM